MTGAPTPSVLLRIYVDGGLVKERLVTPDQVVLGNSYSTSADYFQTGSHTTYGTMLLKNDVGEQLLTSNIVSFTISPPPSTEPLLAVPSLSVTRVEYVASSNMIYVDFVWSGYDVLGITVVDATGVHKQFQLNLDPGSYGYWAMLSYISISMPISEMKFWRQTVYGSLSGAVYLGSVFGDKIKGNPTPPPKTSPSDLRVIATYDQTSLGGGVTPASGVGLVLAAPNVSPIFASTDASGTAVFSGVPLGTYTLYTQTASSPFGAGIYDYPSLNVTVSDVTPDVKYNIRILGLW